MKFGRIFSLGTAFVLCSASTAFAAPKYIVTAPALRTVGAAQTLYCDITNLDDEPQDVTVEGMNYSGAVVAGPVTFNLPPNNGQALFAGIADAAWCRFTVNTATKKFRGIAIYDNGSAYTITIAGQ